MNEIQGLVETSAYVDDLDEAERFYRDVLGLTPIAKEPGRHAFFRVSDRDVFLLFRAETTLKGEHFPVHGTTGPGHFAFAIAAEALDDWRRRLERLGVAIEQEAEWPRGGRSLYFRDPANNLVELITPGVWGLPSGW